ncbi:3'(2'),5'-bisphosphate nucleotidase CysQ [Acanthopleuribacter pedis]|uniref:3'(2'),5'-bisphosphate nucleotidase CysQ n=1 Tax=Acanthopleuribacter pedis TaxID=442870 RepID=A0A8J7Q005_9BACT|nr:3'(2'),5'-bisphosphate nucleotidase CysQ [Acanthopleuribacter pedis]MBO1316869.1 3'(2'),5'-bisphosphate nucleotidase CysQ [Acanthopleuribacter pedis]
MSIAWPEALSPWQTEVNALVAVARDAGRAILRYYGQDYRLDYKSDDSPVTSADQAAHQVITETLAARFPDIPIISEEGALPPYETRRDWPRFWLVDPLDGTREFISGSGEFTVNIALIEQGAPIRTIVYVPLTEVGYVAARGAGAYRFTGEVGASPRRLQAPALRDDQRLRVTVSRSHPDANLQNLLATIPNHEQVQAGSTLKFCFLAEGSAEVYPRFHALAEWDVAAAHLVASESGVLISNWQGDPLQYNSPNLKLDGGFLATTDSALHQWLCNKRPQAPTDSK